MSQTLDFAKRLIGSPSVGSGTNKVFNAMDALLELCSATMHKRNGAVAITDLDVLKRTETRAAFGALQGN